MGKGLMTLSCYHSDRMLLSPVAAAGLLTVMHSMLDAKNSQFCAAPSCRVCA